jgi:hypothetical protein
MENNVKVNVTPQLDTTGFQQAVGQMNASLHSLTPAMLHIATGGTLASSAWMGIKGVIEESLLGPMAAVVPVATGVIAAIRGIVSATGVLRDGMESLAKFEVYTGQFTPLLKSAEAAKKRVEELVNFSKTSPFRMDDVVAASRNLEVLTKGAYSSQSGLKIVGDGAAMAGVSMEELSAVVGRLHDGLASGRAVGDATARLQELGLISGTTRNKIEMLQESGGEIGSVFSQAFGAVEQDLMRASGSMDALNQSSRTLQTTLADTIAATQRMFAAGSAGAEKSGMSRQTKELEALQPAIKTAGEAYGFLPAIIEHVKSTISAMTVETKTFGNIANAIVGGVAVLLGGALVVGVGYAAANFRKLIDVVSSAGGIFQQLTQGAGATSWGQSIQQSVNGIQGAFDRLKRSAKIEAVLAVDGVKDLEHAQNLLTSAGTSGRAQKITTALNASNPAEAAAMLGTLQKEEAAQRIASVSPKARAEILQMVGLDPSKTHAPADVEKKLGMLASGGGASQKAVETALKSSGTANLGEMATAAANYAAKAGDAAPKTGLLGKALAALATGGRAVVGMLTSVLVPTIALMAVVSAATYVFQRFQKVWDAQDEARKSAEATKQFADSLVEASNNANTAAERMDNYKKVLEKIKAEEQALSELRKNEKDYTSKEYQVKVTSKKADIATLQSAKGKIEDMGATSGFSAAEMKVFKDRIALEKELQQATKERLTATLTGQMAVLEAEKQLAEAIKKSQAADKEHAAYTNTTQSAAYQQALENQKIDPKDRVELSPEELAATQDRLAALNRKQQRRESIAQQYIGSDVEGLPDMQEQSSDFEERQRLEAKIAKHDNAIKYQRAGEQLAYMQESSGSKQLALDKEITDSNTKISSLSEELSPRSGVDLTDSERQKKEAQLDAEKNRRHDLELRRAVYVQENNPEELRKRVAAFEQTKLDATAREAQETATTKQGDIEARKQRDTMLAKDTFLARPEMKGKTAAQVDSQLRGEGFVEHRASIETQALDSKRALMEEALANQQAISAITPNVERMSQKQLEAGSFAVQENGKQVKKNLLTARDMNAVDAYRNRLTTDPEYQGQTGVIDEKVQDFARERARFNLTQLKTANGAYGNEEQIRQGITQIDTEKTGIRAKVKTEVQEAAVQKASEQQDARRLQLEGFIAALKSTGYQRAVDEGQARIKAAEVELSLAQEKAKLKESSDSDLAAEEARQKKIQAEAIAKNGGTGGLEGEVAQKQIEKIQAVRGTDAFALQSDLQGKNTALDTTRREQQEMLRVKRLETGQAVRGQQVEALRLLENKAPNLASRNFFRGAADEREDASTYNEALERGKAMFGGAGKDAKTVEKQSKNYAQLTTIKAQTEREIERQSTPTVASDLAKIGGAAGEVAGGDVPKQQLNRLTQVVALLEKLNASNNSQSRVPVDPLDF